MMAKSRYHCPPILPRKQLISTLLLCTLTAQLSEVASSDVASSVANRRPAVAARSMRYVGSDSHAARMTALASLPKSKDTNDDTLGRAVRAGKFVKSIPEVGNLLTKNTQTAVISSEQTQQLCEYTVVIRTGKQDGAGTDSDISVRLSNSKRGDEVYFRHLENGHRTFARGHEDVFVLRRRPCVFDVCRMVLYTDDSGLFSVWFVVSLRFSMAVVADDGRGDNRVEGPIVVWQEKRWEIDEWLPRQDDSEELFIVRDDCS